MFCTSKIFFYSGWKISKSNPGPRKSSTLRFCHWNLKGLAAHKFTLLSLIGYINVNEIDIIYSSEMILDSSIPIDDYRLSIPGYSVMRADHPSNSKRGEIRLYYKKLARNSKR